MGKNKTYKEKLDKFQKTDTIKGISFFALLFIIGMFCLYLYISNTGSKQVTGKAITMVDATSESGQLLYIVVELENGERIRAVMPARIAFRINEEVLLVEYVTKFFGVKKYRLIGFTKELEKEKSD